MSVFVDSNILLRTADPGDPKHSVKGVQSHDARIVAAMNIYSITHLLTFNVDDFKRYKEIEVIRPA